MANNKFRNEKLSLLVMRRVYKDDVIRAKRLLAGSDEQDKKMIVSTVVDGHVPLCVAATRGNTAMMNYLVKDCQANVEGEGDSCEGTPLWCAASRGRLDVVKLLHELGADIDAVSQTNMTAVNNACFTTNMATVQFLVELGADIHRPNERGETCLMNAVGYSKLCRFLIDNGALVNAQDIFGNTALHHAIAGGYLETVQLLLDHGSDQNMENNLGDDALKFASIRGRNSIVMKLVTRQEPTPSRLIESQQLLGSYRLIYSEPGGAMVHWRRAVTLRLANPCADSHGIGTSPIFRNIQEVNTLEELEALCRDEEMMYMYALKKLLQILDPCRQETTNGLVRVSKIFYCKGIYRRAFDLMKYAFQLLQPRTQAWTEEYSRILGSLNKKCWKALYQSEFEIVFYDVFDILNMLTLKAQSTEEGITCKSLCLEQIILFVHFAIRLVKSPDQMISCKRVVHRLVSSQIRSEDGRTLLHRAAEHCSVSGGCLRLVELFLECGADVNAVDCRNNTPLHLCKKPNPNFVTQSEREEVIELLLRYSAHVDIVNDSGDIAAKGLSLRILDHVNLQCLAAAVIRDCRIPYEGKIPVQLELFVQMHGRLP